MICIDCVTPMPLKRLISENGKNHTCQHCGNDGVAIEPRFLFDYILERAHENIATVEDLSFYEQAMVFNCGSESISLADADMHGVLAEWMELGDEPYFSELYVYIESDLKAYGIDMNCRYFYDDGSLENNEYESKWEYFIGHVKHSYRFFNSNAREFLDSVFDFLLSSEGDKLKSDCIRSIRRGEALYRARSATTDEEVERIGKDPANQLGPAPNDRASSQRMTPNGISALYCSLERETCLSEIRSITGDNVVSIAMTPVDQLTLLDLTKLELVEPPELTLLDRGYRHALQLRAFVNSLVKKLSKPKGRNDELSYLSTQIVFEYLRLRFGREINGLVFPSVQTGGRGTNVVLFPEASIVSAKNYRDLHGHEPIKAALPEEEEPFEHGAKLYCLSGSLRFHKIKAVETKADEYTNISELLMSDLLRARLGFY